MSNISNVKEFVYQHLTPEEQAYIENLPPEEQERVLNDIGADLFAEKYGWVVRLAFIGIVAAVTIGLIVWKYDGLGKDYAQAYDYAVRDISKMISTCVTTYVYDIDKHATSEQRKRTQRVVRYGSPNRVMEHLLLLSFDSNCKGMDAKIRERAKKGTLRIIETGGYPEEPERLIAAGLKRATENLRALGFFEDARKKI